MNEDHQRHELLRHNRLGVLDLEVTGANKLKFLDGVYFTLNQLP